MKKVIAVILVLVVALLPCASFAETGVYSQTCKGVDLQGFSYDMSGDSSDIEEGFFANVKISGSNAKKTVIISESNILGGTINGTYILKDTGDGIYQTQISKDGIIVLDLTSELMIDIIEKETVYALGGDRQKKVAEILDASKAEEGIVLKDGPQRNLKAVSKGQIASAKNSELWTRIFYDRKDDSQISFSIQTMGNKVATKVLRVKLDGNTNSVNATWTNPSGSSGGIDWVNSIAAVLNNFIFFIPAYTSGTVSSTNGKSFAFDARMNANWNEMRGNNATVFWVALESAPTSLKGCGGDVTVTYRISTVGSFSSAISVYV